MLAQFYPLHQQKVNLQKQIGIFHLKKNYNKRILMVYTTKQIQHLSLRATFGRLLSAQAVVRTLGACTCTTAARTTSISSVAALCVVSGGIRNWASGLSPLAG